MRSLLAFIITLWIILGKIKTFAQETNNFNGDKIKISSPPHNQNLSDIYLNFSLERFEKNTRDELIYSQFPNRLNLSQDEMNHLGGDIFNHSIKQAGRQLAEELPVYNFLNGQCESFANYLEEKVGDGFGRFTRVFIGNTVNGIDEESLDHTSIIYQSSEDLWREKIKKDGYTSYGFRPQTSPYLFLGASIRKKGRELATFNLRYYYRNLKYNEIRFLLEIPLDKGLQFDLGSVYSPNKKSRNDGTEYVTTLRLSKSLRNNGVIFVGTQITQDFRLVFGTILPF